MNHEISENVMPYLGYSTWSDKDPNAEAELALKRHQAAPSGIIAIEIESDDPKKACLNLDPAIFHPIKGDQSYDDDVAFAKSICDQCAVKDVCLTDATTVPYIHGGILGGKTDEERRNIIRNKNRVANKAAKLATAASKND